MMKEIDTNEIETESIESYHIDLPYLKKKCYNKNIEIERLCKIFVAKQEEIHNLRGEEIMDEAIEELEKISKDEKIIGLYDAEKVEEKIINTRLESAKIEGKKEKSYEVAKKLLSKNIPLDEIVEITELNKEEIEKLN